MDVASRQWQHNESLKQSFFSLPRSLYVKEVPTTHRLGCRCVHALLSRPFLRSYFLYHVPTILFRTCWKFDSVLYAYEDLTTLLLVSTMFLLLSTSSYVVYPTFSGLDQNVAECEGVLLYYYITYK